MVGKYSLQLKFGSQCLTICNVWEFCDAFKEKKCWKKNCTTQNIIHGQLYVISFSLCARKSNKCLLFDIRLCGIFIFFDRLCYVIQMTSTSFSFRKWRCFDGCAQYVTRKSNTDFSFPFGWISKWNGSKNMGKCSLSFNARAWLPLIGNKFYLHFVFMRSAVCAYFVFFFFIVCDC